MSKLAGLAKGPVLGVGTVIAVAVGVGLYLGGVFDPKQSPSEPEQTNAVALLQPAEQGATEAELEPTDAVNNSTATEETVSEEQIESAPDAEQTAAVIPLPPAPSIDTFRLDPDGSMLVAGQAHPGWTTNVMLDGEVLDRVTPDEAGKFVAFLSLDPSDQPRILSLMMRDEADGHELASLDEIIIAPAPSPTPVPEQEPAKTVETEVQTEPAPVTDTDLTAATQPEAEALSTAESQENMAVEVTKAIEVSQEPQVSQTVLLANEEGVQVIQPATPVGAAPEVMSNVALDAISYSEQGEVQLSGRGQREGFVRVYLDNAPVTTLPIAEDGNWRGDLPEVDTGVYTLRIDETDAEGNVTSRVETPFKREDEALVSQAQDAVAQQRITAVTVQPGSTLWAISRERYGEGTLYVRVFEANRDRIRNPDLIYPGQVFNLPE